MGIDWTSPASLTKQNLAMHRVDLVLFGICLWECVVTLWNDIEIVLGRRPFRWPAGVYWITKYSALWFAISVNITEFRSSNSPINCQALGDFIDLTGRVAMAGASCLFMLRTIALWKRDMRVTAPLVALHLAQWGFYLHNVFMIHESWNPSSDNCKIYTVTWPWLKAQFIYTMCFDLIVLILACYALAAAPGPKFGAAGTSLWKLLFMDGIAYFLIAFTCYLACVIVAYINISVLLAFMFSDAATILTAIAACRSYVRIGTYSSGNASAPSTGTSNRRTSESANIQLRRPKAPYPKWNTSSDSSFGRKTQLNAVHSAGSWVQCPPPALVDGVSVTKVVELRPESMDDVDLEAHRGSFDRKESL